MNCFVIGATIIVVGAGVYYMLKKSESIGNSITPEMITLKEVDIVKLSCIGTWLKDLNVDSDDFGKSIRLYAFKDIESDSDRLGLPKNVMAQVNKSDHSVTIAFVLTDMDSNTKHVLIVTGQTIEDGLKAILKNNVTEIHLK